MNNRVLLPIWPTVSVIPYRGTLCAGRAGWQVGGTRGTRPSTKKETARKTAWDGGRILSVQSSLCSAAAFAI